MSDIVQTRQEAGKLFENIHNLLWNEAGFNPEKALDHMQQLLSYRLIEPQIEYLKLPEECKWSHIISLPDEHAKEAAVRKGINSFRRNDKTTKFFKPHDIKKADLLSNLITEINKINIKETDILGDVFEYMIGRGMSTMADEGQYFTERTICRFAFERCLEVRESKILRDDGTICTFCDPFCGTGGFVNEYVKGISQELKRLGKSADWASMKTCIYAQDKSESAARTTLLNQLINTGQLFSSKNIREGNSYQDSLVIGPTAPFSGKKFDYMMMNPPYGGDKSKASDFKFRYYRETKGPDGRKHKSYKVNPEIQSIGIEDHDKVSAGVQLAMATLSEDGGVCAIVLPQGFFFGATKKNVELRKKLAEEYCVHYIGEIASGAFANTGTKTAMMVFQRGVGPTKEIQFINLDREPLAKATLEDLRGKNYSFNYKQYVPQEKCEIEGFEMVRLGDMCDVNCGKSLPKKIIQTGSVPVIGGGKIVGYHSISNRDGNEFVMTRVGNIHVSFMRRKYFLTDNAFSIVSKNEGAILTKYLYHWFTKNKSTVSNYYSGTAQPVISKTSVLNLQIPLPSLERQKEIVRAIEVWEDLAHREEEMVKMLEKQMMFEVKEMGRGKKRVRLGDVCEIKYGDKNKVYETTEEYPKVGGGVKPTGYVPRWNINEYTPIVSRSGSAGFVSRYSTRVWAGSFAFTCLVNKDKTTDDWVYFKLKRMEEYLQTLPSGSVQQNMNRDVLRDVEIPLPPLAEQERLQSDFDEIRHKHAKIAEYRAKAQEAIRRMIPGADSDEKAKSSKLDSQLIPTANTLLSVVAASGAGADSPIFELQEDIPCDDKVKSSKLDSPQKQDFKKMKLTELKQYARDNNIRGYSTKNKTDLLKLIENNHQSSSS